MVISGDGEGYLGNLTRKATHHVSFTDVLCFLSFEYITRLASSLALPFLSLSSQILTIFFLRP